MTGKKGIDNVIHLPTARRPGPGGSSSRSQRLSEDSLPSPPPTPVDLPSAIEAVLFALGTPTTMVQLKACFTGQSEDELLAALTRLRAKYTQGHHGLQLVQVAGGWQIRTRPSFARWVARARGVRPFRLSRAALETLSIIAYRQPTTRSEIEDVRGVDAGGVLRTLLEKELVRCMGHRAEPGRPLIYGTTERFLEVFGLKDIADLPTLRDLDELKDDHNTNGP